MSKNIQLDMEKFSYGEIKILSRGRVGRSGREGFTYLFYTDKSLLSRIAMGALDGVLHIPHSDKRLAGFKKDKKQLGAEIHRKYSYEGHVADYILKDVVVKHGKPREIYSLLAVLFDPSLCGRLTDGLEVCLILD